MTGAALTSAEAIALIEAASSPADIFGPDAARRYRQLARLTHPDANAGDSRAASAFMKLLALWRRHQGPAAVVIRGDIANLYPGPDGILKISRDPADNDLMRQEAVALRLLRDQVDPQFQAYFPRLLETRRQQDPATGVQRRANLLVPLAGFVTLADLRAAYPGGVDPRDAVWMWRRLLVAIGAAHRTGLIHAAVLPEHVLIHPADHGLVLVDWCYSAGDARVRAIVRRYADWYPPEIPAGHPAGPDLDIWLATRCMTALAGARMPAPMAAFARGCLLPSPRRRPADAWQLLAELDELLGRMYGPRTFHPFARPA